MRMIALITAMTIVFLFSTSLQTSAVHQEASSESSEDICKLVLNHIDISPPSGPIGEESNFTGEELLLSLQVTPEHPLASNEVIPSDQEKEAIKDFYQGNKFYNDGNFIEALGLYEKAIEHVPSSATLWYYIGDTYYHLKYYKDAVKSYNEAIRIHSDFKEAWYNIAVALRDDGMVKEAQEALDHYKELNGNQAKNGMIT